MIRLNNINRSLVMKLEAAQVTNPLQILASFSDNDGTSYMGSSQISSSNGTTQVTLVSAPGSGVVRDIDAVTIFNKDTVQQNVDVYLYDTATPYQLVCVNLQPNESLIYSHADGWKAIDVNGCLKTTTVPTTTLPDGIRAVTQTLGDTSTKLATDQFVANALAAYAQINKSTNSIIVDLGSQPLRGGHFMITGSGFIPGTPAMVTQAADRPNCTLYDSIEMDSINVTAIAIDANTIQCNWRCRTRVCNQYKFNYWM